MLGAARPSCGLLRAAVSCGTRTHATSGAFADIQRGHPRHQLSRLLSHLLRKIRPPSGNNQIPAAARRSQHGRQGGIACSRQQCRTLATAPSVQTK